MLVRWMFRTILICAKKLISSAKKEKSMRALVGRLLIVGWLLVGRAMGVLLGSECLGCARLDRPAFRFNQIFYTHRPRERAPQQVDAIHGKLVLFLASAHAALA